MIQVAEVLCSLAKTFKKYPYNAEPKAAQADNIIYSMKSIRTHICPG